MKENTENNNRRLKVYWGGAGMATFYVPNLPKMADTSPYPYYAYRS